jgi:hypothetical protein
MLAGRELAARCTEGRLDTGGRVVSRRERKQALTGESSSRWAGSITRASEDAWQLAMRNLEAERASLKARVRKVTARLAVPETTGHHAAACVIGRRGLGHRARRRVNGNRPVPEDTARPARRGPGSIRQPDPHPGNPPAHETDGGRPAVRPEGLTG